MKFKFITDIMAVLSFLLVFDFSGMLPPAVREGTNSVVQSETLLRTSERTPFKGAGGQKLKTKSPLVGQGSESTDRGLLYQTSGQKNKESDWEQFLVNFKNLK